jgi:2-C-methyl-D-erythritol 4-phosphate cytidylyltransferase
MVESPRDFGVVLAAAGSGSRFGGKKQLLLLGGKPLLWHALETVISVGDIGACVVVTPTDDVEDVRRQLSEIEVGIDVIPGGPTRQASVLNGVLALSAACRFVLVHDAARPLVTRDEILRLVEAIRRDGAAALGYPSVDSVKESAGSVVRKNLERDCIWLVQTPQGGRTDLLRAALEEARDTGFVGTDEASFFERAGVPVTLVEGSRDNIKVTYPEDMALAEFLLSRRV